MKPAHLLNRPDYTMATELYCDFDYTKELIAEVRDGLFDETHWKPGDKFDMKRGFEASIVAGKGWCGTARCIGGDVAIRAGLQNAEPNNYLGLFQPQRVQHREIDLPVDFNHVRTGRLYYPVRCMTEGYLDIARASKEQAVQAIDRFLKGEEWPWDYVVHNRHYDVLPEFRAYVTKRLVPA